MRTLAELHDNWFQATDPTIAVRVAKSPAMAERQDKLQWWLSRRDLSQLVTNQLSRLPAEKRHRFGPLAFRTTECVARDGQRILQQVDPLCEQTVVQHFVIRDIWSDHVLFCKDRVTGVIDFGAARVDEPAADLARLTGSLEPDDESLRTWAIETYHSSRQTPVGGIDVNGLRERTRVLDESSTLLSALQWLEWTLLNPREFPGKDVFIQGRWSTFLDRMEGLSQGL